MEMDWSSNMTKDFSLVAWSTDTAVNIAATTFETVEFQRNSWPLLARQSDDMNAANESGADLCYRTPQQTSINTFTSDTDAYSSTCGRGTSVLQFNGADEPGFMYVHTGLCRFDGTLGIIQDFTFK